MPAPGAIIGWEAAGVKQTRFVESAIRQVAALRARQSRRIDVPSTTLTPGPDTRQHISARHCRCRGCVAQLEVSAMPTTLLRPRRPSGSTRNECIRAKSPFRRGPLRNLGDVAHITADHVAWYNQQRLMYRLGRIPPAEAEAEYFD